MRRVSPRNPRAEAEALLPAGLRARVLEPSPPAVVGGDYDAEDPTDPTGAGGPVVSPVSGTDHTWDEIAAVRPEIAEHAADHWLGARRSLVPLAPGYERAREALHQVAFFVLAPKRHEATGRLGLRFTRGGFGTPFFGDDEQVRVEGSELVVQRGGSAWTEPLTSIREAAEMVGITYRPSWFDGFHDPPPVWEPDIPLAISAGAAAMLGDWFGFATAVLEEVRRTPGAVDVTRVQLWPEHFDPALEMGTPDRRASYGGSPGDPSHSEPYLYVSPWSGAGMDHPYWNDAAFGGASLCYAELLTAPDPYRAGIEFLREGHRLLSTR